MTLTKNMEIINSQEIIVAWNALMTILTIKI